MAAALLPAKLAPDMLVIADRNFYGFKLWQLACASGAKMLWRVNCTLILKREQDLPDSWYLSTVYDSEGDRQRKRGVQVTVDGPGGMATRTGSGPTPRVVCLGASVRIGRQLSQVSPVLKAP